VRLLILKRNAAKTFSQLVYMTVNSCSDKTFVFAMVKIFLWRRRSSQIKVRMCWIDVLQEIHWQRHHRNPYHFKPVRIHDPGNCFNAIKLILGLRQTLFHVFNVGFHALFAELSELVKLVLVKSVIVQVIHIYGVEDDADVRQPISSGVVFKITAILRQSRRC